MKKLTKSVFGLLCAGAFVVAGVTGCSGIKNIENDQQGIVYNGSVVSVGDYLFYANGFASGVNDYGTSSESEYNIAKQYSYLARTNASEHEGTKFENSSEVNKISDRIAGYSNIYMFVAGDYIYYATPNMHKTGENKHVWTYVSIMRCKLDGSKSEEIYTTKAYNSTTAQIRALNYDSKNYLVIYDGTNLVRIDLSGKTSVKEISNAVTSVALPKEKESWNGEIYFTENRVSLAGQNGNVVYKASIKNGEKSVACQENGLTITFTGRVSDKLFYTREAGSIKETYTLDLLTKGTKSFNTAGELFYSLEIANIEGIAETNTMFNGVVFSTTKSSATQIMYYNYYQAQINQSYEAQTFVEADYANTVVVYGEDFYYSTANGIFKKSVLGGDAQTIVSDMTITSGKNYFGYDYYYVDGEIAKLNNIYFYAEHVYDESAEDYDSETATDKTVYLYGVDASGVRQPKLFSKEK